MRWSTSSSPRNWPDFPSTSTRARATTRGAAGLSTRGSCHTPAMPSFPYFSSNYPPLWSYLVSIPMAWLGPGLGARARVHAGGSCYSRRARVAALRLSNRPIAGVLAAGFFLASPYVFHTTPLARVNSVALLAAVVGLTLLETSDAPARHPRQPGAGAALFTKPTAIDAVVGGHPVPAVAPAATRRPVGGYRRRNRAFGLGR